MKAVDMKGREIKAGDTIAYGMRYGSCGAELAIYIVDKVTTETSPGGRVTSSIKATKAQGLVNHWRGKPSGKPVHLHAPERALVINETAATW